MDKPENCPPVGSDSAPTSPGSPGRRGRLLATARRHRGGTVLLGLALFLALLTGLADTLLAGPMRSAAERKINSALKGYTVRIRRARPRFWKLAFALDDLVLVQDSHPEPPVADFASLEFALRWSQLLRFKVAGDLILEGPALHLNLAQLQEAATDQTSLKDQGWQRAVEAIYPFKLDRVQVRDGSLLYLAAGGTSKPLRLTHVAMVAQNLRNIAATPGTYPSPVRLEGVLFDTGRIEWAGAADFLREPYSAVLGEIRLERVPLDRLTPLAEDYQLKTTGGFLSARGTLEYTPEAQKAHLTEVRFEDLRVDYVTSPATRVQEQAHARQALKLAKDLRNAPRLRLQMDSLKLSNSQIGLVNETTTPPYRMFMSAVSLQLTNLGNQADSGRSEFQGEGTFMGSGTTVLSGGFRSTARPADFDVRLKLDNARLTDLNQVLMAYAKVDVADGTFSAYTELTVKNGQVEGYLKPLFRNLRISDPTKDRAKPLGKRVELHVLQFFANLFKNRSSKEVATVVRISGPTSDPKASEWQAIGKLIGNGLYRAIQPGFLDQPASARPRPALRPGS